MRPGARGFTLVEVLLAILIGSLLLSTIYGIFSSVSNARNRLETEGEAYHQVRIFFDRVGGELRSMHKAQGVPLFDVGQTLDGGPYFAFATELVSPLMRKQGGVSLVRYEVRKDEDTATIYRSEQVAQAGLAPVEGLPFIDGVKNFQLRYYQNGSWLTQWSPGNTAPQLLEISFDLELDGRIIPFRSSFALEG